MKSILDWIPNPTKLMRIPFAMHPGISSHSLSQFSTSIRASRTEHMFSIHKTQEELHHLSYPRNALRKNPSLLKLRLHFCANLAREGIDPGG